MLACLLLAAAREVRFSGWVVPWNRASVASFRTNRDRVHIVMPEWIMVRPDGTVQVRESVTADCRRQIREIASARPRVTILLMASNFADGGFEPKRMSAAVATAESRRRHARELLRIVRDERAAGVDLDYESMRASDRDGFSLLVEEIARQFRAGGKTVSVTVHPKTSEPGNWEGPQAQDWRRLGRAVDQFRVMTYDMHWATSDPGPIAADAWVEQVMTFAATVLPKSKLWLGVPAYGYDWGQRTNGAAASLTFSDIASRLPLREDLASGELTNGSLHFAAAASVRRKVEIARRLGLAGVAQWYIGSEDPATWGVFPSRK